MKITTKVQGFTDGSLLVDTYFGENVAPLARAVINMRDEAIKQALVTLGWTPPGGTPAHPSDIAGLQQVITDLRATVSRATCDICGEMLGDKPYALDEAKALCHKSCLEDES